MRYEIEAGAHAELTKITTLQESPSIFHQLYKAITRNLATDSKPHQPDKDVPSQKLEQAQKLDHHRKGDQEACPVENGKLKFDNIYDKTLRNYNSNADGRLLGPSRTDIDKLIRGGNTTDGEAGQIKQSNSPKALDTPRAIEMPKALDTPKPDESPKATDSSNLVEVPRARNAHTSRSSRQLSDW